MADERLHDKAVILREVPSSKTVSGDGWRLVCFISSQVYPSLEVLDRFHATIGQPGCPLARWKDNEIILAEFLYTGACVRSCLKRDTKGARNSALMARSILHCHLAL
ncbi:unnamed protein product [Durusdinium trenchii]|uniref:Protein kinase domain-containing protein n=1 Tax=Durusdinium trenchii TaxID=1381693 RepID=A0ABP0RKZ7_9DINO